jgi:hypothetical protein
MESISQLESTMLECWKPSSLEKILEMDSLLESLSASIPMLWERWHSDKMVPSWSLPEKELTGTSIWEIGVKMHLEEWTLSTTTEQTLWTNNVESYLDQNKTLVHGELKYSTLSQEKCSELPPTQDLESAEDPKRELDTQSRTHTVKVQLTMELLIEAKSGPEDSETPSE